MDSLKKLKENLAIILKEKEEQKKLEDAKRAEKNEADRSAIFESVGKDLGTVIGPYIDKLKENSDLSTEKLKSIIAESVHVEVPNIDTSGLESVLAGAFANFRIPPPEVSVNIPPIDVPPPILPDNIKISNWPNVQKVLLESVDWKHPLAVIVVDEFGKPFYGAGVAGGTGAGPKVIADIQDYRGISLIDSVTTPSQPVLRTSATVTFPSGTLAAAFVDSSGVQYSGSNPVPITGSITASPGATFYASDAVGSVNMIQVGGTDVAVNSGVANNGTLRVIHATDAVVSVNIVSGVSSGALGQGDAATATRVVVAGNSDSSVVVNSGTLTAVTSVTNSIQAALVDSSGVQYSGSNPLPTTASLSVPSGQGDAASALRVVVAGNSDASVVVNSGTLTTVTTLTSVTNSIQAALVDSSGVQYSGSNPLPTTASLSVPSGQGDAASALRVVVAGNSDTSVVVNSGTITTVTTLTGVTNSVQVALVDSSGVQYSGSNPLPTTASLSTVVGDGEKATALRILQAGDAVSSVNILQVNGTTPTLIALGSGEANSNSLRFIQATDGVSSVSVNATAMTTLPTAVSDGASSKVKTDKLGRQVSRPMQVRDLISTAYVTLSTGTETTLLAATAGQFLDLIYIMGANTSNAAQQVDIRAVTAGNVVMSLYIPANSTAGVALPVAFPQDNQGNNWTVDMADVTNSNILISALFSKES